MGAMGEMMAMLTVSERGTASAEATGPRETLGGPGPRPSEGPQAPVLKILIASWTAASSFAHPQPAGHGALPSFSLIGLPCTPGGSTSLDHHGNGRSMTSAILDGDS